jgi:large subunit ribosomal protein L24
MQTQVSRQPRKQRKAAANAPLHVRHAGLNAHLSEALLVKYNRRSFPVVKGDTVKVLRGAFRGHEEKVASVDVKMRKVTIEGVTNTKADGTKKARPVDPSNLVITRLNLTDALRRERLLRTGKVDDAKRAELEKELEAEAKAQKAEIEKFKKELEERQAKEKEERREKGETEAKVDPVTQKPVLARKDEEKHEHAGGEHLEKAQDEQKKEEEK